MSEAALFRDRARRLSSRIRRSPDVRELWGRLVYVFAGTPARRDANRKRLLIGGPPAFAAAAIGAWMVFRPVPQPDYKKARLDKVFSYTLLTDEFNRLSIEKRMELIGQLVARMKEMSTGDSVVMASFAAGIAGAARKQIEENASRLAIDLWDRYAVEYQNVPAERRADFLDKTFVEFIRTMEAVAGESSNKSDEELLSDVRRQAERDRKAMADPRQAPPPQALGRMFTFLRYNVGSHASPAQKTRGQLMLRDMTRHFRGQDGGR
jgi:hypothetical protein